MLGDLISDALKDFGQVAALARATFPLDQLRFEILGKPHRAKALPLGEMAVYSFFLNERALKVGKVGPNSGPRFRYQHYTGSALSTLSGSILSNQGRVGALGLDRKTAGDWIRSNTDRIDVLMPATFGIPILSLLESFLHVRWNPLFEGREDAD
jgi:hypothetical protein